MEQAALQANRELARGWSSQVTADVATRAASEFELNMMVYQDLASVVGVENTLDEAAIKDCMTIPCGRCQTVDKYGNRLIRTDETQGFTARNCKSFCPNCIQKNRKYSAQYSPSAASK